MRGSVSIQVDWRKQASVPIPMDLKEPGPRPRLARPRTPGGALIRTAAKHRRAWTPARPGGIRLAQGVNPGKGGHPPSNLSPAKMPPWRGSRNRRSPLIPRVDTLGQANAALTG
jgi:hypothetical protein